MKQVAEFVAVIAIAFGISGCAAAPQKVVVQKVDVPVPVQVPCPAPKLPPKPALLPVSGTPEQIMRALVADLAIVMGDDDQVRALSGAAAAQPKGR